MFWTNRFVNFISRGCSFLIKRSGRSGSQSRPGRHNNSSLGRAYSSYNETKRLGADDKKWSINRLAKETIDNLKPFVIYALNWMNFGLWTKYQTLGSSQLGYNQGTFNFGRAQGFYLWHSLMSFDLLLWNLSLYQPDMKLYLVFASTFLYTSLMMKVNVFFKVCP